MSLDAWEKHSSRVKSWRQLQDSGPHTAPSLYRSSSLRRCGSCCLFNAWKKENGVNVLISLTSPFPSSKQPFSQHPLCACPPWDEHPNLIPLVSNSEPLPLSVRLQLWTILVEVLQGDLPESFTPFYGSSFEFFYNFMNKVADFCRSLNSRTLLCWATTI